MVESRPSKPLVAGSIPVSRSINSLDVPGPQALPGRPSEPLTQPAQQPEFLGIYSSPS